MSKISFMIKGEMVEFDASPEAINNTAAILKSLILAEDSLVDRLLDEKDFENATVHRKIQKSFQNYVKVFSYWVDEENADERA